MVADAGAWRQPGTVAKKQWKDLSPSTKRFIIIGGTFEGLLKIAALIDLRRRPAELVRGSKKRWAAAIVLSNSVGAVPIAYLIRGRIRKGQ
jgi:hypothetical protein